MSRERVCQLSKDTYILNREAVKELVNSQKGRAKKTRACEYISEACGYISKKDEKPKLRWNILYNKVNICNPKTRTIPFFVASIVLQVDEFKDFVLDVRRTLILINATGETLFVSNEKIVLTIMLLFYEEKEWWTPKEIIEKAKEAGVGDSVLKLSSIEETLNNKKRKAKEHELFTKDNENDCYCLNVNGIIKYIGSSEKVDHSVSPILT